ncbi:helix-turn-helix transcriptional regulator [Arthrobacter sp. StoSoilB13]|uniref:helix-turn-helix domain-containing protein n=1 Tax=Arthrobacter sp. StoSoilB13 TaxID=2830993 RepID=UPI001CC395B8|nr:helix-turn-helix transcriptional regulator [Arthrobacter sp. StoSoilB13]
MSTTMEGLRVAPEQKNPEDIRVGETLKSLLHRVEQTPQGYYLPRTITHEELAKQVRTRRSPRGVSRGYITQLCNGEKHMTNEVLYAIAHYLGINPVAIKQPDPEPQLQHLFAAA